MTWWLPSLRVHRTVFADCFPRPLLKKNVHASIKTTAWFGHAQTPIKDRGRRGIFTRNPLFSNTPMLICSFSYCVAFGVIRGKTKYMDKHCDRHLGIYDMHRRTGVFPYIRLTGKWLRDNGFEIGDRVRVTVRERLIVIEAIVEREQKGG